MNKSASRLSLKPSELTVDGDYIVTPSSLRILISDIKRIEVLDLNKKLTDSWGEEILEDNKLDFIESSLSSLKEGSHESISIIYKERGVVSSINLSKDLVGLSIKNKVDGSIYLVINETHINIERIFFLVPTTNEKIVGSYISINEYPACNGESPFNNPSCYLNQYL